MKCQLLGLVKEISEKENTFIIIFLQEYIVEYSFLIIERLYHTE